MDTRKNNMMSTANVAEIFHRGEAVCTFSSFQQSSGLGKLMSALHKNAESLVTTKAEHNGPDQVLAAAEFTSSVRNKAVTLRREEAGLGAEEPLSVPSLLHQVSVLCCYEIITACHDNHGKWHCALIELTMGCLPL